MVLAAGAAAGYTAIVYVGRIIPRLESQPPSTGPGGEVSPPPIGGACVEKSCNFLLLGSDSRAGLTPKEQKGFQSDEEISGFRSDTIILVHVDAATKHATIVHFPRDLWVNIPGHGWDKINAAFSIGAANGRGISGGANLVAETIQKLTGLKVNHAMVVDLAGFENIVDALGGVPFCTPVPLRDDPQAFGEPPENQGSGLQLDAGCHVLPGDTALALVRARYVIAGNSKDCISDFSRISRQQQFLRAVINKALSPSEIPRLPEVVPAVAEQLTVDEGFQVVDLVDLTKNLEGVASGNADFRVVPSKLGEEKVPEFDFPLSVLRVQPQAEDMFQRLRDGRPLGDIGQQLAYTPPSPADIRVRVYDDASEGKAQNDVYTANLSNAGFAMMATQAEPAGELAGIGNVILYNKGFEDEARVVQGYVPGLQAEQATPGQLPGDTMVGLVIDESFVHKNVGQGKTPTVQENCPYL